MVVMVVVLRSMPVFVSIYIIFKPTPDLDTTVMFVLNIRQDKTWEDIISKKEGQTVYPLQVPPLITCYGSLKF